MTNISKCPTKLPSTTERSVKLTKLHTLAPHPKVTGNWNKICKLLKNCAISLIFCIFSKLTQKALQTSQKWLHNHVLVSQFFFSVLISFCVELSAGIWRIVKRELHHDAIDLRQLKLNIHHYAAETETNVWFKEAWKTVHEKVCCNVGLRVGRVERSHQFQIFFVQLASLRLLDYLNTLELCNTPD